MGIRYDFQILYFSIVFSVQKQQTSEPLHTVKCRQNFSTFDFFNIAVVVY